MLVSSLRMSDFEFGLTINTLTLDVACDKTGCNGCGWRTAADYDIHGTDSNTC